MGQRQICARKCWIGLRIFGFGVSCGCGGIRFIAIIVILLCRHTITIGLTHARTDANTGADTGADIGIDIGITKCIGKKLIIAQPRIRTPVVRW